MFVADSFPDPVRELKQESDPSDEGEAAYWKTREKDKR
jgi:hypothetical protein